MFLQAKNLRLKEELKLEDADNSLFLGGSDNCDVDIKVEDRNEDDSAGDVYFEEHVSDDDWESSKQRTKAKKRKRSTRSTRSTAVKATSQEDAFEEEESKQELQCYRCGDMFSSRTNIRKHLTEKHDSCRKSYYGQARSHQCHVCKVMFEDEEQMSLHICRMIPHQEKWGANRCDLCDLKFPRRDLLVSHNLSFHISEQNFVCDQCPFKTKTARSLTMHKKRRHEQVSEEVCYICGKSFFDHFALKLHMEIIHASGDKQYVCDKCGSSYNSMHSLRGHVRDKHPVYYLCTFCETMFTSSRKLRIHFFKEHNCKCGIKDFYVCWKCQKCCSSSKDLDEHLKAVHDFNDCEKCQLCIDKSFSSKVTLKMHVVESHDLDFSKTSNSPYISLLFNIVKEANIKTIPSAGVQCPTCERMFSSSRTLADHRRQVHEKGSHMACDQCEFTAFQPYLMKRHVVRKHTKTTKYECDQCSYYTFDVGAISVHKRRVHQKTQIFKCDQCDKGFEKRVPYAQHLLQSHNIVYQYNS